VSKPYEKSSGFSNRIPRQPTIEQATREVLGVERQREERGRAKVGKAADPQVDAAARLTAWITFGALRPTADDFGMLRLFLLTLLPQLGGLVLMVARR
jgi:hypothetical protein